MNLVGWAFLFTFFSCYILFLFIAVRIQLKAGRNFIPPTSLLVRSRRPQQHFSMTEKSQPTDTTPTEPGDELAGQWHQ